MMGTHGKREYAASKAVVQRLILCALGIIFLLAGARDSIGEPGAGAASDLWVAQSEGLYRIGAENGTVDLSINDLSNAKAVAVDEKNARVWAADKDSLRAYGLDGQPLLEVELPAPSYGIFGGDHHDDEDHDEDGDDIQNIDIEANPHDGSVWVGKKQRVFHYSPQGNLINTIALHAMVRELSYDESAMRLWVGTRKSLAAYGDDGAFLLEIPLPRRTSLSGIDVEQSSGALWVALDNKLRLYSSAGALLLEQIVPLIAGVSAAENGLVWVRTGKHLLLMDVAGTTRVSLKPFPEGDGWGWGEDDHEDDEAECVAPPPGDDDHHDDGGHDGWDGHDGWGDHWGSDGNAGHNEDDDHAEGDDHHEGDDHWGDHDWNAPWGYRGADTRTDRHEDDRRLPAGKGIAGRGSPGDGNGSGGHHDDQCDEKGGGYGDHYGKTYNSGHGDDHGSGESDTCGGGNGGEHDDGDHHDDGDNESGRRIITFVADTGDGSVWVASKREIVHVLPDGTIRKRLTKYDLGCVKLHDLDLGAGGTRPPQISILFPSDGELLGTGSPAIEVSYSSQDSEIDTQTLAFEANGQVLPVDCPVLTQTGATCVPLLPFNSGDVTLSAVVADEAGNFSDPASVAFRVNGAPTIAGLPPTRVDEDTSYTFTPAGNDPDLSYGDFLSFEIQNLPAWAVFDPLTGNLSGLPDNSDVGFYPDIVISVVDSFGERASLEPFVIEVVNVNDPPTIAGTPATSIPEDQPYAFVPTAADDDLIHGDVLVFEIQNSPQWASFDTATGALTGTPANEDVGSYEGIVIEVVDLAGARAALPAFNIEVINVNDPPGISGAPAGSVLEDEGYSFIPTASDDDLIHGDVLIFSIQNRPEWAQFNPVTGALTGIPRDRHVGVYGGIVISVSDTAGATAVLPPFSIEVLNVNDAPRTIDSQLTVFEDSEGAVGTLPGDDLDGPQSIFTIVTNAAQGSAEILDAATGAFRYVPYPDATGADSFTFQMSDGELVSNISTLAITIIPVNDPPVATGVPPVVTDEDVRTGEILLTGVDDDNSESELTVEVFELPVSGALSGIAGVAPLRVVYTPNPEFSGSDRFAFVVRDLEGARSQSVWVEITVNPLNDVPLAFPQTIVVQEDSGPFASRLSAADPDGPTLQFQIVAPPGKGVVNLFDPATGDFIYTPLADQNGLDGFTFTASDGLAVSNDALVSVVIVAVNDPPVISGVPDQVTLEDEPYLFVPTILDDSLPEESMFELSIEGLPLWAVFDAATGQISGTPLNSDVGITQGITLSATDTEGLTGVLGPFSIEVINVNDAPIISAEPGDPAVSVEAGSAYSFAPLAADDDLIHGDALAFEVVNAPPWAQFSSITGELSGTPVHSDIGVYPGIEVSVVDLAGARAALPPFQIAVTGPNSPPEIVGIPATLVEVGKSYSFTPIAFDDDLENGDVLTFSVEGLPGWTSFDPVTGTLAGVPQTADLGSYPGIVITVTDSQGASDSLPPFTITVVEEGQGGGTSCEGDFDFSPASTFDAGVGFDGFPSDLVLADINLDGLDDMIMVGPAAGSAEDLCTQDPQSCCFLTPDPLECDLSVVPLYNLDVGFVSVFLAQEDASGPTGSFDTGVTRFFPGFPVQADTGNLNGDSLPDLVVAAPGVGAIVLQGTGLDTTGWFEPVAYLGDDLFEGGTTVRVLVEDMDTDNNDDIVTFTELFSPFGSSNRLQAWLGLGTGTDFVLKPGNRVSSSVLDAVSRDFNGDGVPDLAVMHAPDFDLELPAGITIFAGDDPLSFGGQFYDIFELQFSEFESDVGGLVSSDFNADGFPDLAVSGYSSVTGASMIQTFLAYVVEEGGPTGEFYFHSSVSAPRDIFDLATGDFNRDGIADLAAIGYADVDYDYADVFLGNGTGGIADGGFTFALERPLGISASVIVSSDLNLDGASDLAAANGDYLSGTNATVLLAKACQGGSINVPPGIYGRPKSVAIANQDTYVFRPAVSDPNPEDVHEFSVQNLPPWAVFDTATGLITGSPTLADVALYSGVVVSVTDGRSDPVSLAPFDINVINRIRITFAVPPAVTQGDAVSLVPVLEDTISGRTLSFSAENLSFYPWLTLDPQTGILSGTPQNADVDTSFENFPDRIGPPKRENPIRVQVSDGVVPPATSTPFTLTVLNRNDNPVIGGNPVTTIGEVAYIFIPSVSDPDNDLQFQPYLNDFTFSVQNLPPWATFKPATGEIRGVPDDVDVGVYPGITVTVTDDGGLTDSLVFTLTVENTNEPPEIVLPADPEVFCRHLVLKPNALVPTCERWSILVVPDLPFGFDLDVLDEDFVHGTEVVTFSAEGLPAWLSIDPATGLISGMATAADRGSTGEVRFEATDLGGLFDRYPSGSSTVPLTFYVNSPPLISGVPDTEVIEEDAYLFVPKVFEPDGDPIMFKVENLPAWAEFDQNTGILSGTPGVEDVGVYEDIRISVFDLWADDRISPFQYLPSFSIEVINVDDPPAILLADGLQSEFLVTEGGTITLQPTASDRDAFFGDSVTFQVSGLPPWMSFNPETGEITGTPSEGDVGGYFNISITAVDQTGLTATTQSFSILVRNVNNVPLIGGIPVKLVAPGTAYTFAPSAYDPDAAQGLDTLTFSVANLPPWASFDPATGAITGTPGEGDIGIYRDVTLTVRDASGEFSVLPAFDLKVVPAGGELSEVVGPAPAPASKPTLFSSTKFLYEGPGAVQTGLDSSILAPGRVSVVRGRVTSEQGRPLVDVAVSVVGKPEFGQTLTQSDGTFSLVVNGIDDYTLRMEAPGFLTAYRFAKARAQQYTWVEDVALLPPGDEIGVAVSGEPVLQVLAGPVLPDAGAGHRSVFMIQPGTQAQMILADGTSQAMSVMNFLLQDIDSSPAGEAAMPANFRDNAFIDVLSGLVAQAQAVGAKRVEFDRPVSLYTENFTGLPVGGALGTRYYDEESAAWRAGEKGRVIEITGSVSGMAQVDIDGDGLADDPAELEITPDELQELAARYPAGAELTRVRVTHLSYWLTCSIFDVAGSDRCLKAVGDFLRQPPTTLKLETDFPVTRPNVENVSGVLVEPENQAALTGQDLVGTPFGLVYSSDRAAARSRAYFDIALTPPAQDFPSIDPEGRLRKVSVELQVAGKKLEASFEGPQIVPDLTVPVFWDGTDAYGRKFPGSQTAQVALTYEYETDSKDRNGNPRKAYGRSLFSILLGNWTAQTHRIGGWSLSAHHSYDPVSATVYRGDGSVQSYNPQAPDVDEPVLIEICKGHLCQGDPLLQPEISIPLLDVFSSLEGYAALIQFPNERLYVNRSGERFCLEQTSTLAVDPREDEEVLTAFFVTRSIIKSDCGPGGEVLYDDIGEACYGYLGDKCVRDVSAQGCVADEVPLDAMKSMDILDLAVDDSGRLYMADRLCHTVSRLDDDGIVRRVAGTGTPDFYGDGGPATQAALFSPFSIDFDQAGNLYIADASNGRIRKVTPAGIITTVIGNTKLDDEESGFLGCFTKMASFDLSGKIGSDAVLCMPTQVRVDDRGQIVFNDFLRTRQFRLAAPLPALDFAIESEQELSRTNFLVTSAGGGEVYVFDAGGRHLETRDSLTNAVTLSFAYDPDSGLLTGITDRDGLTTTLVRDAFNPTTKEGGQVLSIIGPTGQETDIERQEEDLAATITNPAGEATAYSYVPKPANFPVEKNIFEGLLSQVTTPRSENPFAFGYEPKGRLSQVLTPAGSQHLLPVTRNVTSTRASVSAQSNSAGGLSSVFSLESLDSEASGGGTRRRQTTFTNAASLTSTSAQEGTIINQQYPDGTSVAVTVADDPRWRGQVQYAKRTLVTTPSGLQQVIDVQRLEPAFKPEADYLPEGNPDGIIDNPLLISSLKTLSSVNGRTTTGTFEADSRTLTVLSPEGRKLVTRFDERGRVAEERIGDLTPASYAYDERGRLTSVTRGTRQSHYTYDANDRLASVTDPAGSTVTFPAYDEANRVLTRDLPDTGSGAGVVGSAYDPNGNLTALTIAGAAAPHTFGYSSLNELIRFDPPSLAGQSGPDLGVCIGDECPHEPGTIVIAGFVTVVPDGRTLGEMPIHWFYNHDRQLLAEAAPTQSVGYSYDGAGRLQQILAGGTGDITSASVSIGTEERLTYAYDDVGRLSSITGAGRAANGELSYTYDGSLLTGIRSAPDFGQELPALPAYEVSYTYDSDFRLEAETTDNAAGSVSYEYTDDGLLARIVFAPNIFNGSSGTLEYGYDANGLLNEARIGVVDETFESNSLGELVRHGVEVGGQPFFEEKILERDAAGRILKRLETRYRSHPTLGTLKEIREYVYAYDARGWLAEYEENILGDFDLNGVVLGQPSKLLERYFYDDAGNRVRKESIPEKRDPCIERYEHDGQNRLIWQRADGDCPDRRELSNFLGVPDLQDGTAYLWNDSGQLTQAAGFKRLSTDPDTIAAVAPRVRGSFEEYEYNALGQLVQSVYPRGRLIPPDFIPGSGGQSAERYTWDPAGHLTGIYRPIAETPAPDDYDLYKGFQWSGDSMILALGPTLARLGYAPGGRVPQLLQTNRGLSFVHTARVITNHLGSPLFAVDVQSGEKLWEQRYGPWGEVRFTTRAYTDLDPYAIPMGLASGLWTRGTNLVRFGARDYDPHTGRWTARDPVLFNGGQDNLYIYCNNDPVNCIDVTGREPVTLTTVAVAAALAAVVAFGSDAALQASYNGWDWSKVNWNRSIDQATVGAAALLTAGVGAIGLSGAAAGTAAVTAASPAVPTAIGTVGEIIVGGARLAHILARHFPGGSETANKSIFNATETVAGLISLAQKVTPVLQRGGRYQRIVDAGRTIGIDRVTGLATSTYTVITDAAGNLITMFPGTP